MADTGPIESPMLSPPTTKSVIGNPTQCKVPPYLSSRVLYVVVVIERTMSEAYVLQYYTV